MLSLPACPRTTVTLRTRRTLLVDKSHHRRIKKQWKEASFSLTFESAWSHKNCFTSTECCLNSFLTVSSYSWTSYSDTCMFSVLFPAGRSGFSMSVLDLALQEYSIFLQVVTLHRVRSPERIQISSGGWMIPHLTIYALGLRLQLMIYVIINQSISFFNKLID